MFNWVLCLITSFIDDMINKFIRFVVVFSNCFTCNLSQFPSLTFAIKCLIKKSLVSCIPRKNSKTKCLFCFYIYTCTVVPQQADHDPFFVVYAFSPIIKIPKPDPEKFQYSVNCKSSQSITVALNEIPTVCTHINELHLHSTCMEGIIRLNSLCPI